MEQRAELTVRALRLAGAAFVLEFGSRARGTARPDSDLDVAALWTGAPPAPWDVDLPAGVDLVILNDAPWNWPEVIAFRLHAHNLTERLSEDPLLEVAGRCAVQNSPLGSALLALHARVHGMTQARLDASVADEKRLLQTWCMRGWSFCFPTADAAVFTAGVLPPTEASLRHFLPGVGQALDRLGFGLTEAVDLTIAEIVTVLSGRRLAINELGAEVAERVASRLPAGQRRTWEALGLYASGQPLGEAVVHFCVRILSLQGVACFAPRAGNTAPFVLVAEWLGHPIPASDPEAARAELLRRYLRCYGPSTLGDFAA